MIFGKLMNNKKKKRYDPIGKPINNYDMTYIISPQCYGENVTTAREGDKVAIDIAATLEQIEGLNKDYFLSLLSETDRYRFYIFDCYDDYSGGSVLRQSKDNPYDVTMFCCACQLMCINKNKLYGTDYSGEMLVVYVVDCDTLETETIDCFGKGRTYFSLDGFGHYFNQDAVEEMKEENGKVHIKVNRAQSDPQTHNFFPMDGEQYDYSMDYTIIISETNGKYSITYNYGEK